MRLRRLASLLTLAAAVWSTGCSCCHKHTAPAACPQGCPPGPPPGGVAVPAPPVPATSGYFPPVSAVSTPALSSNYPIDYRP
jgi:hypothetical protein